MGEGTELTRNGCALQGALGAIHGVRGAVPVIHSTPGCSLRQYWGAARLSGCGAGTVGGQAVPSTNLTEKHIIFGGGSRLREQLKNTVKVVDGRLYLVVTGCAAEMIGDDTPALVKESREQGNQVGYVPAPGFRGDTFDGYVLAVKEILQQLPHLKLQSADEAEAAPRPRVNLWGIMPGRNPFWQGQLNVLADLLKASGVEANTLFGFGQELEHWSGVPSASLNLVFSHRALGLAEWLQSEYGTPYLYSGLPVGIRETRAFVTTVAQALDIEPDEAFLKKEEDRLIHHLDQWSDIYWDHGLQRTFAIVGDSEFAVGAARYLVHELGLLPHSFILTDRPAEEHEALISDALQETARLSKSPVHIRFTEDHGEITDTLLEHPPELLIGSSLEAGLARKLDIPFIEASFPLGGRTVVSRSYIGFAGAYEWLEDLGTAVLQHEISRSAKPLFTAAASH